MKFKSVICIICVVAMLALAACSGNTTDPTTTTSATTTVTSSQTTTTGTDGGSTTTVNGENTTTIDGDRTTTNQGGESDTTTTTTTDGGLLPTIGNTSDLMIEEVKVNGLPVIVGDKTNRLRVDAAGFLNGNKKNPMFILITNVGEDDVYSATINANAGGKEVCFNISYLPRGASVWAESVDNYIYSASDNFIVRNDAVIVSATMSGVPVDVVYSGILKIYAGVKSGSRGLYVENISGKKISKLVIRYRPRVEEGGLFAAPYVLELGSVENGSRYFKPNSYLYDVDIVDVQVVY